MKCGGISGITEQHRATGVRAGYNLRVISSGSVAAWVAQVAFWAILGLGIAFGELKRSSTLIFLALWAVGFFVLPRIPPYGGFLVTPYIAVLDIVLVFLVFKEDVRLS